MPLVIHRSIILTLEVVPSGVSKCTAERATAAIAREWLQTIGQQVHHIATHQTMPALQIYMRQLHIEQGAHIQILLCWVVLQAQRQEINDFNRSV